MSRIIGVLNHKGGTGKTTTAVNLASGLALRGARVLCIDLDPQGSLAVCFGVQSAHTLADLILGKALLATCILPARNNLDVIASNENLVQAEGMLWRLNDDHKAHQLVVSKLAAIQGYDFIILDYSPSVSLMGQSGLMFTRELIVPVSMDYMALVGTRQVIKTLKEIGRIPEHQLKLSLVVPTFFYGRLRKDREVLETLGKYFTGKVAEPIRANVKIAEAPSYKMSIFEYAPYSSGAEDYLQLVDRVISNG